LTIVYIYNNTYYVLSENSTSTGQLLFSLLSSSCIVVSIRESVNTLYPFTLKLQDNQQELSNYYSMNIEFNLPREHSADLSLNSSREISLISTMFLTDYIK